MKDNWLVQEITGLPETGKTAALFALQRGYISSGFKVAHIVPTEAMVRWLAKRVPRGELESIDLMSYHTAFKQRKIQNFRSAWDVVLIDDIDIMPDDEGDVLALLYHIFQARDKPLAIFYARSSIRIESLRAQHWFKRLLLSFLPDRSFGYNYGKYFNGTLYTIGNSTLEDWDV